MNETNLGDIYDYFIIGTGLSGITAARRMSGKKYGICYGSENPSSIDNDFNPFSNFNDGYPKAMKTSGKNSRSYIIPNLLKIKSAKNLFLPHSITLNGFSEVWGASILPLPKNKLNSWSKKYTIDLNPFLENIYANIFKSNFSKDDLNCFYNLPLKDISNDIIVDSSQSILQKYQLRKKIIKYLILGKTRLAIKSQDESLISANYCDKSGTCLTFCPRDAIFKSEFLSNFEISDKTINNFIVTKLVENINYIEIFGIQNGIEKSFKSKIVFLAAGTFGSAKILLNSVKSLNKLYVKDSRTVYELYFSPFKSKAPIVGSSLSQLTALGLTRKNEIFNLIQFYEFSDDLINNYFKFISKFSLLRFIVKFFLLGIKFQSSNESNSILVERYDSELIASLHKSRRLKLNEIFNNIKLKINLAIVGVFKVPFISIINKAGSGVHSGSWFHADSSRLILDNLGRYKRTSKIHVIDASALPEIPIGPITITVMANALRIVDYVIKEND